MQIRPTKLYNSIRVGGKLLQPGYLHEVTYLKPFTPAFKTQQEPKKFKSVEVSVEQKAEVSRELTQLDIGKIKFFCDKPNFFNYDPGNGVPVLTTDTAALRKFLAQSLPALIDLTQDDFPVSKVQPEFDLGIFSVQKSKFEYEVRQADQASLENLKKIADNLGLKGRIREEVLLSKVNVVNEDPAEALPV